MKTMTITEFRNLNDDFMVEETTTVTRYGKPVFVLMPIHEYEAIQEQIQTLSQALENMEHPQAQRS